MPVQAESFIRKGNVLQDEGKFEEAALNYRKAIQANPNFAQAYNNLGIVLRDQNKTKEAIEAFRKAIALEANYFRAHNNLGSALHALGCHFEAIGCFERAIQLKPDYFLAMHNLAVAYLAVGSQQDAEAWFRRVLNLKSDYLPPYLSYGRMLLEQRKLAEAEACLLKAVQVGPRDVGAYNLLGDVLVGEGNTSRALAAYRHGLALDPRNLQSALGANLTLPQVYSDSEMLRAARAQFEAGLRALQGNIDVFKQNPLDRIPADILWSNFYLAYQGQNDKLLQKQFSSFVESLLAVCAPQYMMPLPNKECSGRKIRLGFLSSFFYRSTIGSYFSAWVTSLDRYRFEIFVYHTNFSKDEVTEEIMSAADHFNVMPPRIMEIAERVREDDLDVLIYPEIGMNGKTNVLSSMRLAPVQCAGWGHPVTTGHANIDYFLSCALMEPGNAQEHYTEKLALLPGIGTYYRKNSLPSAGARSDFSLPDDKTLYLCPQSLFKIHPDNDELFLQILDGDQNGVLVLFAGQSAAINDAFMGRLAKACDKRGLNKLGRVKILPNLCHEDYLRINMLCDIMLDTLYWSGGNTSLDALSCGLPIVTLPGEFMRGRQSYGMLMAMSIPELVARDKDDYVKIALLLGKNHAYRLGVAERIRNNVGQVFENEKPIKELERLLVQFAGNV